MYGMSPEMLQRLYVKGSLKNQDGGFVLQIKNTIDSGSVSGVSKLDVDGEERSLDGVTIELSGKVRPVSEITWSASLYVSYGATLTLYVPGELEPGEHSITVQFVTAGAGRISVPITDTVA